MKRLNLLIIIGALVFSGFVVVSPVGAQTDNHTAREEAEGEIVWQKLQSKEIVCGDLSDEDFGALGEYYMGQMLLWANGFRGVTHPQSFLGRVAAGCR